MREAFGFGAHFFAGLAGRADRLFGRVREAFARLAADDVAEGFLEALGAPVGTNRASDSACFFWCLGAVAVVGPGDFGLPIRQAA